VVKYSPQLEEAFHRRKRPIWISWRLDETYSHMKSERCYLYRAFDKQGEAIDFLLTEHRDKEAAVGVLGNNWLFFGPTSGPRRYLLAPSLYINATDALEDSSGLELSQVWGQWVTSVDCLAAPPA
jgi:hypothetical protein